MGYSCNACGRYVDGGGSCGCYAPSPQPSIETKLREMLAAKSADLAAARAKVERVREAGERWKKLADDENNGRDEYYKYALALCANELESALKGDAA